MVIWVVALVVVAAVMVPVFAPLRHKIERPDSSPPAVELVALPLLVEGQVFIGVPATIALLGVLVVYLTSVTQARTARRLAVLGVMAVFAIPLSRPIGNESLLYAWAPALLGLLVLTMSARRRTPHSFVASLVDGVGLYLVANVVAYAAGVVSPGAAVRVGSLEASGGGLRVIFPIATSLAVPAAMAAIYVAAAAICFERSSPARVAFRVAALGCAGFVLVKADTRAALVVAVVLLTASIVSTRALARLAVPVVAVSAVFAFAYQSIQGVVGSVLSGVIGVAPGLSRGDTASDLQLNFRSTLWERVLTYWQDDADMIGQAVGFGVRGQQQSGASSTYAADFTYLSADPRAISVHNSYLQQLYDGGAVGLVALVALLLWAAHRYAADLRDGLPGTQLALPALLAAVTTSITEVTIAPGYGAAPAFVVAGLVIYAGTSVTSPRSEPVDRRNSHSLPSRPYEPQSSRSAARDRARR